MTNAAHWLNTSAAVTVRLARASAGARGREDSDSLHDGDALGADLVRQDLDRVGHDQGCERDAVRRSVYPVK